MKSRNNNQIIQLIIKSEKKDEIFRPLRMSL